MQRNNPPQPGSKLVDPAIAMFTLLDDMVGKLSSIQQLLEEEVPRGLMEQRYFSLVAGEVGAFRPFDPWFSIAITVDGANTVYVQINQGQELEVRTTETLSIDMRRAKIKAVTINNRSTGASSGRIVGRY